MKRKLKFTIEKTYSVTEWIGYDINDPKIIADLIKNIANEIKYSVNAAILESKNKHIG